MQVTSHDRNFSRGIYLKHRTTRTSNVSQSHVMEISPCGCGQSIGIFFLQLLTVREWKRQIIRRL
uniref:Uncharacterized protein n=1 Tax=Zea mays TaxID=4577 RepID=C0HEK4_MAIZE|nr:unknown [Zea mays]